MTTTAGPKNAVKFYLALPCSLLEIREKNTISFRIPANKAFPRSLKPIMRKTKRVVSFEKSNIVGKYDTTIVCGGTGCIGYTSTNPITYTMDPLYPPRSKLVKDEKPKIGFVAYVPTMMTTRPPEEFPLSPQPLSNNDFAIFSVTYNNFLKFKTTESYTELYNLVMENQHYLIMINEPLYAQHNLATLNMIQKMNKIPKTTSLTLRPQSSSKQQQSSSKQQQQKVVERFEVEEDVEMEGIDVSTTEEDSTEEETGILATLGPEEEEEEILSSKTSGGSKNKMPLWLIGLIVVLAFIVVMVVFIGGTAVKVKRDARAQSGRRMDQHR